LTTTAAGKNVIRINCSISPIQNPKCAESEFKVLSGAHFGCHVNLEMNLVPQNWH